MIDDGQRSAFAAKLDHLFRTVRDAQGELWTNRAAARVLEARGCAISHAHIGNLRHGRADPRPSDTAGLAAMFGVSVEYFSDYVPRPAPPDGAGSADSAEMTTRLVQALQDPAIRSVTFRMHDGMSEAGKATIVSLVEHVLTLERQGRGQYPPHAAEPG